MKKRISFLLGLSLLCASNAQLNAINWRYHLKIHIPALVGTVVGFCAWKYDKNSEWQKKAVFSTVGALGSWFLTRWGLSWLFSKPQNVAVNFGDKKDGEEEDLI